MGGEAFVVFDDELGAGLDGGLGDGDFAGDVGLLGEGFEEVFEFAELGNGAEGAAEQARVIGEVVAAEKLVESGPIGANPVEGECPAIGII